MKTLIRSIVGWGLALIAATAAAQTPTGAYFPGNAVTDQNPMPYKCMYWNGTIFAPCPTASGGGGGGAITVADGADVAQGSTTDAAYAGSGSSTVVGALKGLYAAQASTNNGISVLGTTADAAYGGTGNGTLAAYNRAQAIALGLTGDAAWSGTGAGSLIAINKAQYAAILGLNTVANPGTVKQADVGAVTVTSLSAAGNVFNVDTSGYQSLVYQPGGTWSGSVAFQGSDDNTNFQTNIAYSGFSGTAITSTTNNTLVCVPVTSRYLRGAFSFTSGTITGTAWLRGTPCPAPIVSSVQVTSQPGLAGGSNNIGYLLRQTYNTETTTAQAASATFNGTSRDTGAAPGAATQYTTFGCFLLADQATAANGFAIQGSYDGTTWYDIQRVSAAIAANVPTTITSKLMERYHRCQLVNGTTAETSLRLNSYLGTN